MALRTSGVRLVAEAGQYKRDMRDAAKVTDDFRGSIEDVRTEGDKLGEGLTKVGKSSGSAFDEMRKNVAGLDVQIKAAQSNLTSLAKSYASTGDSGLLKQIREQKRELAQLKNVRSLLPDAAELAEAGAGVGSRLIGGIRSSFAAATPASLGLGGLGLLMAPTVGAAVSGAVVGGIGIGGVIGGISLAARDQRVKDAGKDLGRSVMADLERRAAAGGFVDATLRGIDRVRDGFTKMGPDLDKVFSASRFVEPLADGLTKLTRGIVSGLGEAVAEADPVIYALRGSMIEVGDATGDLFKQMASDADEGASAITDLTGAITSFIRVTGAIMHATAEVKGFTNEMDVAIDKVRFWIEDNSALADLWRGFGSELDLTADGFKKGSVEAEALRKAVYGTATAADFATLKTAGMTDAQITAADSSGRYRAELDKVASSSAMTSAQLSRLVATQGDVQDAQQEATFSQQAYTMAIDAMAPAGGRAKQTMEGLKRATDNLYSAQIQATDANEAYEASWDALSGAVKKNKTSLDIHTEAGRANRDALQALLASSKEMYFADVNAGVAIDKARQKHEARTEAIRKESVRLTGNKKETDNLIATYGRIPPKKTTNIVQSGVDRVANALYDLYLFQRSLAEGIPISQVAYKVAREKGMPDRFHGPIAGPNGRGYHDGGRTANVGEHEPAGVVHGKEFVFSAATTRRIDRQSPGFLDEVHATGQLPGYDAGGRVAPVETRTGMRYVINANRTRIPTRAQVEAKVMPVFGDWPSSPSAQRGDSGVWKRVLQLIKAGPNQGSFGNAYRPGDPKWHGSGRAVDWMGYNMDALASYLAAKRPLELIHRTNRRDYAYTRGRNKGSFNNALMEAHRNHIHIAMAEGGVVREPVLGVGASGRTYSFGENYRPERVVPMGSSGGGAVGGGNTTVINVTANLAAGANPVEAGRQLAQGLLQPYLAAGGSIVVRGKTILSAG